MKLLLFILLTVNLYAQNPYPDTLFLIDGRSVPCFITGIGDEKIEFQYSNNRNEMLVLAAIKRIFLDQYGIIFNYDSGFAQDRNKILEFIEKRSGKAKDVSKFNVEKQVFHSSDFENKNSFCNDKVNCPEKKKNNRWSFGVLYIPYYSGIVYNLEQSSSYPSQQYRVYGYGSNETNMEAQLSFALSNRVQLTLDAAYTSTYYEQRYEYHIRDNNYTSDQGTLNKEDLTLLNFNLGVKYYFKDLLIGKVSVYALMGMGKQIAYADEKSEQLYLPQPAYLLSQNNRNEFLEELNSPFQFNMGFGAEYFFNESLSLTSNIRFIYSKIDAQYDSRIVTETQSTTNTIDYKKSDFITRIGVGINFHF